MALAKGRSNPTRQGATCEKCGAVYCTASRYFRSNEIV